MRHFAVRFHGRIPQTRCPRPFAAGQDAWYTVLETSPVPIRERNRAIPTRLADVIDRALIDKPEITFKSAAELKRALEAVL